jgi:hypothetical protein
MEDAFPVALYEATAPSLAGQALPRRCDAFDAALNWTVQWTRAVAVHGEALRQRKCGSARCGWRELMLAKSAAYSRGRNWRKR